MDVTWNGVRYTLQNVPTDPKREDLIALAKLAEARGVSTIDFSELSQPQPQEEPQPQPQEEPQEEPQPQEEPLENTLSEAQGVELPTDQDDRPLEDVLTERQNQPETTPLGVVNAATHGLALPAAGAGTGAILGGLTGAGVTAGAGAGVAAILPATLVTDLIIKTVNRVAGTDWPTTGQAINRLLTDAGITEADTLTESIVQMATMAGANARGAAELARNILSRSSNPLVQGMVTKTLRAFSDKPSVQVAEEVGGVVGSEVATHLAEKGEMGPTGTALMGLGGGLLGGVGGSAYGEVADTIMSASSTAAARRIRTPEEGPSPYSLSELQNRPVVQGGLPAEKSRAFRQDLSDSLTGGTGQYQYRRHNENVAQVERVMQQFGVDFDQFGNAPDFSRRIIDDFSATRGARLTENLSAKDDVLRFVSTEGQTVPVPKAIEYLDRQYDALIKRGDSVGQRAAQRVGEWREAILDLDAETLEATRKGLLSSLAGDNNADIRSEGTQILNEAYSLLNEDIGGFIQDFGFGDDLYTQWRVANQNLSAMARDFSDRALVQVMDEWDKGAENIKPEVIMDLLRSVDVSDAQKLYRNLSPEGQVIARQALVADFARVNEMRELSPSAFARNVGDYGNVIGVTFDEEDIQTLAGLKQHFDMTPRSEAAVLSERGFSGPPTSVLPGAGTTLSMAVRSMPLLGIVMSAGTVGVLGRAARIIDQSPHITRMLRELATLDPNGVPARNLARLITRATAAAAEEVFRSTEQVPSGTGEAASRVFYESRR